MAKAKQIDKQLCLNKSFNNKEDIIEIGIDEVGRGPMFGRVYVAAVILPFNSLSFNYSLLKDSKKFHSVKNISSQLNKLIDVVEASDISEKNIVWRELALIKVKCNQSQRVEILELSKVFRVNVVDVGINNITFELAGGKSKIDSFIELLDAFGVLEVMRTGRIATLRGATKVGINDGEFTASDNSDIYIADKDASGSV